MSEVISSTEIIKKYFKDGKYIGPEVLDHNFAQLHEVGITSLKGLVECKALNVSRSYDLKDMSTLKQADLWLTLKGTKVSSLPELERVRGDLDIFDLDIVILPKLKTVEGRIYIGYSKIPAMPHLDPETLIDQTTCGVLSYRSYLDKVFNVPATDLIPLRHRRKELTNLIDARLRGLLKAP